MTVNTSTVPPSPRDYGWYNGRPGKKVSVSHWGMFELPLPPLMMVPADFDMSEEIRREMLRPDGFITYSHGFPVQTH